MKRPLVIAAQDEQIKPLYNAFMEVFDRADDKKKFIEKQLDDLDKEINDARKLFFQKSEIILKERKLIEVKEGEKPNLALYEGVLFHHIPDDNDIHPLAKLFKL